MARILLARLLEGHPASLVHTESDRLIVSANGEGWSVLRDVRRSLPELESIDTVIISIAVLGPRRPKTQRLLVGFSRSVERK